MKKNTIITLLSVLFPLIYGCKKLETNQDIPKKWMVTTVAGASAVGYSDGKGELSAFFVPAGITTDLSGNVYVADNGNACIRKISTDGTVTTLAGKANFTGGGVTGYIDGKGDVARFKSPNDVKCDSKGNIFVADAGNNCIRKITLSGDVTTFAGSTEYGFADGTGLSAKFAFPSGLAIDASDNLYVADTDNNRIRKITSSGVVTTIAGSDIQGSTDGPRDLATLRNPQMLCIDGQGNIYFNVDGRNIIRKLTSAGQVTTIIQNTGFLDGLVNVAKVNGPAGLVADKNNNIYIADASNGVIRKISYQSELGVVNTFAGIQTNNPALTNYLNGPAQSAKFSTVYGITIDSKGDFYVTEQGGARIRKISYTEDLGSITPPTKEDEERKNWNKPSSWK